MVHAVTIDSLFGRQVVYRAQDILVVVDGQRGRIFILIEFRQSHIQDFDHASFVRQQIGGFNIAMDQAHVVGMLQPHGRLSDVVGGPSRNPADRQRPRVFAGLDRQ